MKKYKLKQSVKDILACLLFLIVIFSGFLAMSLRAEQLDKKSAIESEVHIAQNN